MCMYIYIYVYTHVYIYTYIPVGLLVTIIIIIIMITSKTRPPLRPPKVLQGPLRGRRPARRIGSGMKSSAGITRINNY